MRNGTNVDSVVVLSRGVEMKMGLGTWYGSGAFEVVSTTWVSTVRVTMNEEATYRAGLRFLISGTISVDGTSSAAIPGALLGSATSSCASSRSMIVGVEKES